MCINPRYLTEKALKKLHKDYAQNKPFPHLRLPDFFDKQSITKVAQDLKKETFVKADADLFSFQQCNDLKHSKHQWLKGLRNYLLSPEFIIWLSYITGENLKKELDISGFIYNDTDHLLPHDDKLEGRKVAFVINLSTVKPSQGGQLDLFKGNKIAKSYSPEWNSLVIFTVKPGTTLHQVREVINGKRVTIAGWFHGTPQPEEFRF